MRLAVIPARGGSKRIPRKNIREFCGKPIIAWSIEAARRSDCFDEIIVSTDDEEISGIARKYGAETPFVRPSELSDDFSGTSAVMRHAVQWYAKNKTQPSLACCIYATAPFIAEEDIRRGEDAVKTDKADYAFSVARFSYPIQRAFRNIDGRGVEMLYPEYFEHRSQDLEETFHDAAQFYWGKSHCWSSEKPIFSKSSIPIILPQHRVQDIDNEDDWSRAESMFRVLQTR